MAFAIQPHKTQAEEQQEASAVRTLTSGAPMGTVQANSRAPAPTSAGASAARPGGSGQFVNLNRYLDTNKTQAVGMGENLGGTISNTGQQARSAIGSLTGEFGQNVQAGTNRYDDSVVRSVIDNPTAMGATRSQFDRILSGEYKGPQSLTDIKSYGDTLSAANKAAQAAKLGETSAGRLELMRQQNKPATQGGLNLNQFLIQNTEPAFEKVQTALSDVAKVEGEMTAAQKAAQEQALAARTASQQAADQARGTVSSEIARREAEYQAQVRAAQEAERQRQEAERQALANLAFQQVTGGEKLQNHGTVVGDAAKSIVSSIPVGSIGSMSTANQMGGLIKSTGDIIRASASGQKATAASAPQVTSVAPEPTGIESLGVDAATMARLQELNKEAQQYGGGINFLDYYKAPDVSQIGYGQVLSPEEQARYNALNSLIGATPGLQISPTAAPVRAQFDSAGAAALLANQVQAGRAAAEQKRQQEALLEQQRQAAEQQAALQNQQIDAQNRAARAQQKAIETQGTVSGAAAGAAAGAAIGGPVGAVIGGVVGAVFCFTAGTPVLMADGSEKTVEELDVGDETFLGGMVMGGGKVLSNQLYEFRGRKVSGSHLFLDTDGIWKRVKEHPEAVELSIMEAVYPVVTEHAVYVVDGNVQADFQEIPPAYGLDPYSLNGPGRLEWLNTADTARTKFLMEQVALLKERTIA